MKKLLSILAVLAIVLSCSVMGIGTVLAAPDESSEDDFMAFDGVLEEYVGAGGDVVIPASLGIKEIAAQAFANNTDITSIVIPEGVEIVGYWSFRACTSLESITLPYSLCELAEHCFSSAPITEITIPGNVEVVGYGAFSGCEYLEKLTLSYGVREIQVLAFQGTSMEKVVFPETVELICGGSSFGHNKNAGIGKIEYYICNPDCELGYAADTSAKAYKHEWTSEGSPWSHNKGDATYRIYCVEDSEVEKTLNEKARAWLDKNDSGKGDGLKIIPKPVEYFKEMEENQEGYGTPKPSTTDKTPEQDKEPVDDPSNPGTTDKENNQNNTQNGNQTVFEQGGDNTTLIIVVCVIGGIMLLAIIVVVILAATGVLFGKKPAKAAEPEDDPETAALKAELAAAKKAKELEALKAELEALKGGDTAAVEEAPVDETPAE